MTDLQKKKVPRAAPSPSYREIQLAILTELRKHTDLLTAIASAIAVESARADLVEKRAVIRGPLALPIPKSLFERELRRRGVLRDKNPGTS